VSRTPEQLVADLETLLRPLELELAEAWWESNTQSSAAADARRSVADLARRDALSDAHVFAELRAAREVDGLDPLVHRQLDVLYDMFAPHQIPDHLRRRLVEGETAVEAGVVSASDGRRGRGVHRGAASGASGVGAAHDRPSLGS